MQLNGVLVLLSLFSRSKKTTNDTENSRVKVCFSSIKTSSVPSPSVSEAYSLQRRGRKSDVWEYFTNIYKKDSNVVDCA